MFETDLYADYANVSDYCDVLISYTGIDEHSFAR
jgi:hypothetical protein